MFVIYVNQPSIMFIVYSYATRSFNVFLVFINVIILVDQTQSMTLINFWNQFRNPLIILFFSEDFFEIFESQRWNEDEDSLRNPRNGRFGVEESMRIINHNYDTHSWHWFRLGNGVKVDVGCFRNATGTCSTCSGIHGNGMEWIFKINSFVIQFHYKVRQD